MANFVQAIKNPYNQKEGYGVVSIQLGDPLNYKTISPTINKGKTVTELNTLYSNRFNRPRYYTSTPSGLPY